MSCFDCGREYGDEHGFPDLILPQEVWNAISPDGDESGLLCPCCIIIRLHKAGLRTQAAFASGVVESVDLTTMSCIRRLENIEMALEGRQNRWGAALTKRICDIAGVKLVER